MLSKLAYLTLCRSIQLLVLLARLLRTPVPIMADLAIPGH